MENKKKKKGDGNPIKGAYEIKWSPWETTQYVQRETGPDWVEHKMMKELKLLL